jgi:hypothetical protein
MKRGVNSVLLALMLTPAAFLPGPAEAASPAIAQSEKAAAADEEEKFDEKLKEFGYWSGAAFSCVADARTAEIERKIIDTYQRIARLFGTDRAFFYAAAFGRGTAFEIDQSECPAFLEKFEKSTVVRGEL